MRLAVIYPVLRGVVEWTGWLMLACAVSLFAYRGIVMLDAWKFQKVEHARLDGLRDDIGNRLLPAANGDVLGSIDIPRLGVSVIIVEGTDTAALHHAAGHIAGTAPPGQAGNIGIAGHRDTFFRPLRNIRRNDLITLTTPQGEFRYRVISTKITDPSDIAVLDPAGRDILTLVTCYPFYIVGSAPDRFIVRAERLT